MEGLPQILALWSSERYTTSQYGKQLLFARQPTAFLSLTIPSGFFVS
jgi:hypothetical protein